MGDDTFADKAMYIANQERSDHFTLADVLTTVCLKYNLTDTELRSPGKCHAASEARAVAALVVEESKHLCLTGLAAILERDASGSSYNG